MEWRLNRLRHAGYLVGTTSTLLYFLRIKNGRFSGQYGGTIPGLSESFHLVVLCCVPVEFTKGHQKNLCPKVSPRGECLIHSLKLKDTPCASLTQGEAGCLSLCLTMACDGAECCSDEIWVPVIVTITMTDGESGHLALSFLFSLARLAGASTFSWRLSRVEEQAEALPLEQGVQRRLQQMARGLGQTEDLYPSATMKFLLL